MESTTATFFDLVRPLLPQVEARMRSSEDRAHPHLDQAIDLLLASGGKRMRPTLTLLTGRMLGTDEDKSIGLAAAIEMLHTATLVHDDLIDGSLLRRGLPTLNANQTPAATVLTGDYIFARGSHGGRHRLAPPDGALRPDSDDDRQRRDHPALPGAIRGRSTGLLRSDLRQDGIVVRTGHHGRRHSAPGEPPRSSRPCVASATRSGSPFRSWTMYSIWPEIESRVGKPVGSDLRQGLLTLPTLHYLDGRPDGPALAEAIWQRILPAEELEVLIGKIRVSPAIEAACRRPTMPSPPARPSSKACPVGRNMPL